MSGTVERHPAVIAYLNEVCAEVRAGEIHPDIKLEMLGHLEERVEEIMGQGDRSEEEAVAEALRQMGDPRQIGQGLHAAHRPRPEWSVIALVAGMVVIAIVALFALRASMSDQFSIVPRLVFGFAGVAGMIALYFLDYRKLVKLSWLLYGAAILMMAVAHWWGPAVNGSHSWIKVGSLAFNIYAASPYLLIVALAGILRSEKGEAGNRTGFNGFRGITKEWAICALLPGYFYVMAPALVPMAIYGAGLAVLLLAAGKRRLLLAAAGTAAVAAVSLLWLHGSKFMYMMERLTGFLRLGSDSGYTTMRSVEALQSGGLWGQGLGISSADTGLPLIASEMLFPYLVHSLGWVFGAAVVVIVMLFVARTVRMGVILRDDYAKRLTVGLTAVFVVKFVWNIVMCFGWLPIAGMELPLIHWSSGSLIEFAAIGLLLAVYRRKDIVGRRGTMAGDLPASG